MLNEQSIKNNITKMAIESGMYDPEHDKIRFDVSDTGIEFKVIIEKGLPIEYVDIDFYIGNPESCIKE